MKKIISIILAVILISSAFSLTAFAAETPKTDALLNKLETEDELCINFTSGQSTIFSFLGKNPANQIAVKNNEISYEIDNGFIVIRVVANKAGIYAYIPSFPFMYVKLDSKILAIADINDLLEKTSNLTQGFIQFVDSYNETFEGTEYYVEEYNDREFVTSKFYFDGDELVMLKVTDASTLSVQYTYFDEITFEVEDDFFNVPKGAFDLSPILTGLILSIIAMA